MILKRCKWWKVDVVEHEFMTERENLLLMHGDRETEEQIYRLTTGSIGWNALK